jgi:hypothetical protein
MKINASITLLAAAVLTMLAGTASAQVLNPLAFSFTSGTTGDAIVGPAPGDNTANITIDGSAFHLAEQGQNAGDPNYGIPDGPFLSQSNTATKVATFQFGPSNGNNILKFNGTLTLATPEILTNVSFLVQNLTSNATTGVTFTLNFAGGKTESFTTDPVPYWVNTASTIPGGSVALGPVGAIYQTDQNYNGSPLEFYQYDFALASPYIYKTLDSISVNANGNYLITYAASGTLGVAPEPSTWAMMIGGLGALFFVGRIRRNRTSIQG